MATHSKLDRCPPVVSFDEESNREFEIPRVCRKDKRKLWITPDEIDDNFVKEKVRGMVEKKLTVLVGNNSDAIHQADTSCIEGDDDDYDSDQERKQLRESEEDILRHKQSLIVSHLLESIMDRPRREIRSFLTSRATIRFERVD